MNIVLAVLILGGIILFHELGHFIFAKLSGIEVTEFSLGMGPRLLSFVKGEEFNGNCEISFKNETLFVAFILMVFEEWVFMREKGWIGNGSGGS